MQKGLAITILSAVTLAFIICVYAFQPGSKDNHKEPLFRVYADPELKHEIGLNLKWDIVKLGPNNKTVYILNCGANPIRIALLVLALPRGWNLTWDYDGSWIQPNETKRITLTLYASSLDVTRLTLHVTIYAQEVKVIEK
ncbi:hypothetical protein DRO19_02775 [Candidatus Bathyarchaeota archaeon]|nr:MAG: hypothetical protein DRO19_02775 [Candidatus Bathyarchaeota archaeon]